MSEGNIIRERLRSVVMVLPGDGIGSGFYASTTGIVVTNKHVVGPCLSVKLLRHDKTSVEARVVRVARGYDLALLWDQSAATPPPLPLADPAEIAAGDEVHAIGHPRGLDFTVTRGIVSSPGRYVNDAYFVQTDATTHPGSSGGPLLDAQGRVIGVSTWGMAEDGLNFALSVRYVRELLGEMMVKPVAPGFRRCVVCGTKNSSARRSCRKCGADFASMPYEEIRSEVTAAVPAPSDARRVVPDDAPATSDAPPPLESAAPNRIDDDEPAPESTTADPAVLDLLAALERLETPPTRLAVRGKTIECTWSGALISLTVFRRSNPQRVAVSAFVGDVRADDAISFMRRALELNLADAFGAKLGLRGSQIYAQADHAIEGADDAVGEMLERVVAVRRAFLK